MLQKVQAATQLRLVDGLLIIDGLREDRRSEEFLGHGYLNRNRAAINAQRLLKNVQRTTTEIAVRNRFIARILDKSEEIITNEVPNDPVISGKTHRY